eukprot:m.390985 g.390985  ORF g.390985 m.390985 type:complete len:329 (-) comp21067_c0_seq5:619-1605(-)
MHPNSEPHEFILRFADPPEALLWIPGCNPPKGKFGHNRVITPAGAEYLGGWNDVGAHGDGFVRITVSKLEWVSRRGNYDNGVPTGKHVFTQRNGDLVVRCYRNGKFSCEQNMLPVSYPAAYLTPSPTTDERFLPLPQHRMQHQFKYCTSTYDFRGTLYKIFRCATLTGGGMLPDVPSAAMGRELERLHEYQVLYNGRTNTSPLHKIFMSITSLHAVDLKRTNRAALHTEFKGLLKRFVREVVAPLLCCDADDVLYQRIPALRIAEPSHQALGRCHTDYEYNHQPSEVLARVCGYSLTHREYINKVLPKTLTGSILALTTRAFALMLRV